MKILLVIVALFVVPQQRGAPIHTTRDTTIPPSIPILLRAPDGRLRVHPDTAPRSFVGRDGRTYTYSVQARPVKVKR